VCYSVHQESGGEVEECRGGRERGGGGVRLTTTSLSFLALRSELSWLEPVKTVIALIG
jgi:hypothetical protein